MVGAGICLGLAGDARAADAELGSDRWTPTAAIVGGLDVQDVQSTSVTSDVQAPSLFIDAGFPGGFIRPPTRGNERIYGATVGIELGIMTPRIAETGAPRFFLHANIEAHLASDTSPARERARAITEESEKRFRAIFDNAKDGIIIVDLETYAFTHANQAACEMLGYEQDKITNIAVMDVHHPEDLPHAVGQFEKLSSGKIASTINLPFLREDGTRIYCDVNTLICTQFIWVKIK